MPEQVQYGLIGFGKIGSQHAKQICNGMVPNLHMAAVADTDPERLQAAHKMFGDSVRYFESADALIDAGVCQAAHICTPHYAHPGIAIRALNAGLHTLVEKPAGVYTKQVKEMNAVADAHPELKFAMDFNQRTNPVYRKVKELIESGELGQIRRSIWIITDWYRSQSYYDLGGWRATWKGEGGGVLLNQNPHNLDLWQWMCGMPAKIRSVCYYGKHRKIEVEDDLIAFAEYENGATGTYITTVVDAPGTNRLEIDGERGRLVVENNTIRFDRLRVSEPAFNASYRGGLGKPEVWSCEIPVSGKYTAHAGIMTNFCDAILHDAPLLARGQEGLRGLEISNAIHLSDWLGGIWVDLPVDDELFYEKLCEKCAPDHPNG